MKVALDKAGHARAIEALSVAPAQQNAAATETYPAVGPGDRDLRIVREAVLNTAVAILSSGGQVVDIGDVLGYTATLEQWVTR